MGGGKKRWVMKGWWVGVEATGGGSCGGPGRKSNVFEGWCQILIHASLGFPILSSLFVASLLTQ